MNIASLSLFILRVTLQNNGYHTIRSPSEKLDDKDYVLKNYTILLIYGGLLLWIIWIQDRITLS